MAVLGPILLILCWCCAPCCGECCVCLCAPKKKSRRGGCCDKADGKTGNSIRFYAITGISFYGSTLFILAICYYWVWVLVWLLYDNSDEFEEFCIDHTEDDGDDPAQLDDVKNDVSDFCKNIVDSIGFFYFSLIAAGIAQMVYVFAFSMLVCCCGFVTKNGFRCAAIFIMGAVAISLVSASLMMSAYASFQAALDQFIEDENDFWKLVQDVFLGMTVMVLLPAIYATPLELLVCKADFDGRAEDDGPAEGVEIGSFREPVQDKRDKGSAV